MIGNTSRQERRSSILCVRTKVALINNKRGSLRATLYPRKNPDMLCQTEPSPLGFNNNKNKTFETLAKPQPPLYQPKQRYVSRYLPKDKKKHRGKRVCVYVTKSVYALPNTANTISEMQFPEKIPTENNKEENRGDGISRGRHHQPMIHSEATNTHTKIIPEQNK